MKKLDFTSPYEVMGFNQAFDFFNSECRLDWSKEMIIEFANKIGKLCKVSQYAMGFYDAAMIIQRTRKHREA